MWFLDQLKQALKSDFLSPGGYFFIGWIATYTLIGFLIYLIESKQAKQKIVFKNGLKYCFPKDKFWSRSARLDFALLIFNQYIFFIFVFFLFGRGISDTTIANRLANAAAPFGSIHIPISNGFATELIYTVLVLVFADLGWTIQHLLFHKIPRLWEFHKVHHSAEDLNIFTITRLHPVDKFTQAFAGTVTAGLFMGIVKVVLGYQPSLLTMMNVSIAAVLFRIFGIFRHSHIWISFGPKLSHILSSPAMHQIHHSVDERHRDKNFSVVFSFWDRLFNTLSIPKEKERVTYGIPLHPTKRYDGFFECMLNPFRSEK